MPANASKDAKNERYKPDLFTRDEISDFPWIFRSSDRKVYLIAAGKVKEGINLKGFVESDSRPGMYHYVVAVVGHRKEIVGGNGFCECESSIYYGEPCKHVLKIRNILVKDRFKIPGLELIRKEGKE